MDDLHRERDDRGDQEPRDHPRLSPEEHREQRGSEADGIGLPPRADDPTEYDPKWTGDSATADRWREFIDLMSERRPHREDVLPYLLIRAHAPGDRGRRPLWPPTRSWLSPDILLMDAADTGPFDPTRLIDSPEAGGTYRVFVHVWNLGLLDAAGVFVRAWHVAPGYFAAGGLDESYTLEPIGAAFTDLGPRTSMTAHAVVELTPPWFIDPGLTGHECLLASATCPADDWPGALDANHDRHVGQRNITIVSGSSPISMLEHLSARVVPGAMLEIALRPTIAAPMRESESGRGLFVAARRDDMLLVVDALRLDLGELYEPGRLAHAFLRHDDLWALEPAESVADALRRSYDITEEDGVRELLDRFGLDEADIDLAQFGPDGEASGGYTLRLRR